jgi:ABC-type bacteriocin/lantibiotic exporter with double-glycine peptidase domain
MSESLQTQADSRSYQVQMLAGIETLKASGAEDRSVEHWSHLFVRELNVSLDRGRLDALVNSLLDTLATASPIVVLVALQLLNGVVVQSLMQLGLKLAGV